MEKHILFSNFFFLCRKSKHILDTYIHVCLLMSDHLKKETQIGKWIRDLLANVEFNLTPNEKWPYDSLSISIPLSHICRFFFKSDYILTKVYFKL